MKKILENYKKRYNNIKNTNIYNKKIQIITANIIDGNPLRM